VTVPASLQASLMSRLDRLGPAKEVARSARRSPGISPLLLAALVPEKPEAKLDADLRPAHCGGFCCSNRAPPPHASYLFKHRAGAGRSLRYAAAEPRRVLHARIAEILDNSCSQNRREQPELLARH